LPAAIPAVRTARRNMGITRMLSEIIAGVALVFSAYNLWQNKLKHADLRVFVPPVIQYTAPNQNGNLEVFVIPVTLANEGARTGTVLSMELEVTDPRTQAVKRFYSADFGTWSLDKAINGGNVPFAPISLEGRGRRTETVLFYTRGEEERPDQLVADVGKFSFKLTLDDGNLRESGGKRRPASVEFVRELKYYDPRVFLRGTLPMYADNWRSATNA
jgi:hypothetical protein